MQAVTEDSSATGKATVAIDVRAGYRSNTYLAAGGSPRQQASSTAGAAQAVQALARKLLPSTPTRIEFVGVDARGIQTWRITQ
jgi:hypothetical protein